MTTEQPLDLVDFLDGLRARLVDAVSERINRAFDLLSGLLDLIECAAEFAEWCNA